MTRILYFQSHMAARYAYDAGIIRSVLTWGSFQLAEQWCHFIH